MTEPAKDGAECRNHEGRPAQVVCPLCHRSYCVFCYHAQLERCENCLRADPAAAAPAIPFESEQRGALGGFFATLLTAFSPARTAPAFARPDLGRAVRFFLLSAVPLSALAGVIPQTRLLVFGDMQVQVVGNASNGQIALDIVRAMFAELCLDGVLLLALWAPFVSLVRAYAGAEKTPAARRVLLYRAFLMPLATLLSALVIFPFAPPEPGQPPPQLLGLLLAIPQLLPVLLIVSMGFTARLACGLRTGWSFVIVSVAVVVTVLAAPAAVTLVSAALPPAPG